MKTMMMKEEEKKDYNSSFFCYNIIGDTMEKKHIIGIVFIVIFVIIFYLVNKNDQHIISYVIDNKKDNYYIREYYDNNNYYFIIRDNKKNRYSFSFNSDLNDKRKIIKSINKYNSGDLICLYPKYINDNNNDIHCIKNNTNYNISYLKQSNDKDYLNIVKKVEKDKLKTIANYNDGTASKYKNLKVYKKNLLKDYYFTMWNYSGLYVLNKDDIYNVKLLKYDQYDNKLGILLDNYYVYIDTENREKKIKFNYYNILKKDKGEIIDNNNKHNISINIYYNGVNDGLLYFTDKKGKLQYTFSIKEKEVKKITDGVDSYVLIRNNQKEYLNKSVFFEKEQYFDNKIENKKLSKLYKSKDIRLLGNYYYIYSTNGDFYRISKEDVEHGELLFNFNKISTYNIKDLDIILIVEDTLYLYNEDYGLLPIVVNEELEYNYNNICDFYKK